MAQMRDRRRPGPYRLLALLVIGLVAAIGGSASAPASQSAHPRSAATVHPTITIAAVGDTILGKTPNLPRHPGHYLDNVKKALAAPITFGNLEGTLTTGTNSKCSPGSTHCFAFRNPPRYATYLHGAGFDVMNSANNHSHDFGTVGVRQTSEALRTHDLAQDGLPGQVAYLSENGLRIAFVGFAPYSNVCNLLRLGTATSLIRKADTKADLVVVYMHAGAEGANRRHVTGREEYYLGEDRGNPERFAHMAVKNGADLVIASGPHVLRGMEIFRHHLIAYSLADFASFHNFGTDGVLALTGVLRVTIGQNGWFRSGRFLSVKMNQAGRPSRDYSGAAGHLVSRLSGQDFGSRGVRIGMHGVILPRT